MNEISYTSFKHCGASLSFYKGHLVVRLRLEFEHPIDKMCAEEKSFNITSSNVYESYEVSRFTTIGLQHWYPMRKEPVSNRTIKFMCSQLQLRVKKDLQGIIQKDKDEYEFLDD
jgi:hypothetical protein